MPVRRIAAVWLCLACSSAAWSAERPELARRAHETSVAAATQTQPVWARPGEALVVAVAEPTGLNGAHLNRLRADANALTAPRCRASRRAPTRTPSVSRPRDERDGIQRMHACLWPTAGPRA